MKPIERTEKRAINSNSTPSTLKLLHIVELAKINELNHAHHTLIDTTTPS